MEITKTQTVEFFYIENTYYGKFSDEHDEHWERKQISNLKKWEHVDAPDAEQRRETANLETAEVKYVIHDDGKHFRRLKSKVEPAIRWEYQSSKTPVVWESVEPGIPEEELENAYKNAYEA